MLNLFRSRVIHISVACAAENFNGIFKAVFEFRAVGSMADGAASTGHGAVDIILGEQSHFFFVAGETWIGIGYRPGCDKGEITR